MRMPNRIPLALTAVTGALAVLVTSTAGAGSASGSGGSPSGERVLATGVGAPFQIALNRGAVYYADGGAEKVFKVTGKGPVPIRTVPGLTGVEFSPNGKVMAVAGGGGGPDTPPARVTLLRKGKSPVVAEIGRYEQNVNPDRNRTYGIVGAASAQCRSEVAEVSGGPATYKGIKDSHPYQLETLRGGAFALADAGVNAVLRVGPGGGIRLMAVLPPQPVKLNEERARALGAPSCAGATYAFEAVPTDVEQLRPGGPLWVTTLPGGPESPALGARGAVYRVKGGKAKLWKGGFLGATNLAVNSGRFYVTEFFAGKVTKFGVGGRHTKYTAPGAVSVEATHKHLYVGTMGMGPDAPGKVVRIRR